MHTKFVEVKKSVTINVLSVYRTYFPDPPGGLQEAIRQISLSSSGYGVENRIFTLSPTPQPKIISFPEACVIRERSWLAPASCDVGGLAAFRTFSREVMQSDVLQYHFPWPFADVLRMVSSPKIPAVMVYHSDIVRQKILGQFYTPLMMKTLRGMQAIVATSPSYLESSPILQHKNIRDKVRVIPLGIDESTYCFDQDDTIFSKLNLEENEPYFLFLGVLRYYKGVQNLIKAAQGVNAKIVIAGSGPGLKDLKKLAQEKKLENIVFAGQVSHQEKIALLSNCYAFVLPSHLRSEAFGMVLVEASMLQKPMISCEIGTGTSYVNQHEVTGLVVDPDSVIALTEAMRFLLKNPPLVEKMGLAARKRYEKLFSGDVLGRAYANLYQSLI